MSAATESLSAGSSWQVRIAADRKRANAIQTSAQQAVTDALVERAASAGANALALTGSTVRCRRTEISDLDYHVVGPVRVPLNGLPHDVDVYSGTAHDLFRKLRAGDDFVQWTVRYGLILFDDGTFEAVDEIIRREHLWPDPDLKLARIDAHCAHADALIEMGDADAALNQVRATITAVARGLLLRASIFPLARSELPKQLSDTGYRSLANWLEACIYREPTLDELAAALAEVRQTLSASPVPS